VFDRSLLPPARLEFVVVADTHYMIDVGAAPLEFESRRAQGARAGAAWKAIAALAPEFVVHMGDLVQEFPGRPDYDRTVAEAMAQIDDAGLGDRCHFVAGNHDIGDKPDPTMPTRPVTAAELESWQDRHGPSWGSWEKAGIRFISLNSQILNTDLAAAAAQRSWFETCIEDLGNEPGVLFLHLPPYLRDPQEPHLGHYDNIGEPDRSWLLDLVRGRRLVAMFAAHVHFQFYDHLPESDETCRYRVTPSPSFTRPGFGHLFTAAAPAEQGRDDVGKLGFFYGRVRKADGNVDVYRVRMTTLPDSDEQLLLTPLPVPGAESSGFGLGLTLRHPLAPTTEVPVAWPSTIRQPVRNDYPLLSCLDLGARRVRVPLADLQDPVQGRRLELLRRDGVQLQAMALGEEEALQCLDRFGGADSLELRLPGFLVPVGEALRRLGAADLPLVLCPVLASEPVAGKQHRRARVGYRPQELDEVASALDSAGAVSATAACRIDGNDPWNAVTKLIRVRGDLDLQLLCELPGVDDAANVAAVARAAVAAAILDVPLFLEPLVDLDRTMDVANGLLDGLCNPRSAFDTARCVAAVLGACGRAGDTVAVHRPHGSEVITCGKATLVIPGPTEHPVGDLLEPDIARRRVCRLAVGLVRDLEDDQSASPTGGPLLIYPADSDSGPA